MSSKRQSQRHLNKAKREHEESLSTDNTTDSTPASAKRQRKEPKDWMTGPATTALTMSLSQTTIVPNTVLPVYQHMLPKNPEGIAFLFGTPFSEALQVPAERVAIQYQITKEDAIEELRRLLIIKAFTADVDANKISPTPLSMRNHLDPLSLTHTNLRKQWTSFGMLPSSIQNSTQICKKLLDSFFTIDRPEASDQESEHRERRLTVMKSIYRANFSTDPLGRAPLQTSRPQPGPRRLNTIAIFVITMTGKKHTLTLGMQAITEDVKSAIRSIDGIQVRDQRLAYAGKQLDDGRTLECYGIGNESTLHRSTRLVGC